MIPAAVGWLGSRRRGRCDSATGPEPGIEQIRLGRTALKELVLLPQLQNQIRIGRSVERLALDDLAHHVEQHGVGRKLVKREMTGRRQIASKHRRAPRRRESHERAQMGENHRQANGSQHLVLATEPVTKLESHLCQNARRRDDVEWSRQTRQQPLERRDARRCDLVRRRRAHLPLAQTFRRVPMNRRP